MKSYDYQEVKVTCPHCEEDFVADIKINHETEIYLEAS